MRRSALYIRIIGVATVILGILNTFTGFTYMLNGVKAANLNLPTTLFYVYAVICLLFGLVELSAGVNATRAYAKPEFLKSCFYLGLGMIGLEVVLLIILFAGNVFQKENLAGLLYPVIYTLGVKMSR